MGGGAGELRGGEVYLLHAPAFGVEKDDVDIVTESRRAGLEEVGWSLRGSRWANTACLPLGSGFSYYFLFFCKRKVRRKMEFGKV